MEEVGGASKRNTGKFIKWMLDDVRKEGQLELDNSKLTWKQVDGALKKRAQVWFLARC